MAAVNHKVLLIGWSYANQILQLIVGLLQVKVLTYALSQADYGVWVQVNVGVGLLVMAAGLNLGHGFLRLGSSGDRLRQQSLWASILLGQVTVLGVLSVGLVAFGEDVLRFIGGDESGQRILVFLMALALVSIVSVQLKNILIVTNRALVMVRIETITMITTMLCIVIAAWLTQSVVGVMLGALAGQLIVTAALVAFADLQVRELRFRFELLRAAARLGVPLLLASFSYWAINYSNRYFISGFLGAEAVAVYNVANVLPAMIVSVYTLLSSVFFSKISKLYEEGKVGAVSDWLNAAVRYYILIATAIAAVLIVGSTQLTMLVSNRSYVFDDLALVYLSVSLGSLILGLFQIVSRVLDLEKKPMRNNFNWLIAVAVNAALCWVLIPRLGLLGAALALVASLAAGLTMAGLYQCEGIHWRVAKKKIVVYVTLALGAAYWLNVGWSHELPLVTGLALALVAGLAAFGLGWALRILEHKDVELVFGRQP